MGSYTYTIDASHDDSYFNGGLSVCYNTAAYLTVSSYTEGYPLYGALRFVNVLLAQGVKVLSAYLRLRAATDGGSVPVRIRGILQANPGAWENPNCNPDSRPVTTAFVDWSTGVLTAGAWYNTADLSAVLQEALDQGTRVSGDAVAFMLAATGGVAADFSTYDLGDHSSAPQLIISAMPRVMGFMM